MSNGHFWPKTIEEIAAYSGLDFEGRGNNLLKGLAIDSRKIRPGEIFVCLKGEKNDGHMFIEEAVKRGSKAVLIDFDRLREVRERLGLKIRECGIIFSEKKKALQLLQSLANKRASDFKGRIIGITGSSGKTTTRDITAELLKSSFKVRRASENLNTDIGLPLEVVRSNGDEDFWVLEYATRNKGDIEVLVDMVAPDWAVITNIGYAHLGILGSREGIYLEKTSLLKHYKTNTCFIDGEDDYALRIQKKFAQKRIVTIGQNKHNDFVISDVKLDKDGNVAFNIKKDKEEVKVKTSLKGLQGAKNTALAIAVAVEAGVSFKKIVEILKKAPLPPMRFQLLDLNGLKVVNDAYNANPESMRMSLETFALMKPDGDGKHIAILGDMLELGVESLRFHKELGELAGRLKISLLIYLGEMAMHVKQGYHSVFPQGNFLKVENHKSAAEAIVKNAQKGDVVLLKASRRIMLEKVLEYV